MTLTVWEGSCQCGWKRITYGTKLTVHPVYGLLVWSQGFQYNLAVGDIQQTVECHQHKNIVWGRLEPSRITEMLVPCEPGRGLGSCGRALLAVQNSKLKSKGDWVVSIKAPWHWNELPEAARLTELVIYPKSLPKFDFYWLGFNFTC